MEEQKGPDRGQDMPEEEYSFLQEVIKDETAGRKGLKRDIFRMIWRGLVFGLVACISFSAARPWIEQKFSGDPEEVTIPKDDEEEEPAEEPSDGGEEPTEAERYREMLKTLRDVAKDAGKSVVDIVGTAGAEDWREQVNNSRHSVSGVIVADNGQELLILGKICPVKNVEHIQVVFAGGDSCEAVEKSRDNNLKLAVYAVERAELTEDTQTKIAPAALGNSKLVNMGDTVVVIGKPFGYASGFAYGVVASDKTNKNFADGQCEIVYTDVDGSADGSGVIVNMRGEVIGIIDQTLQEEENRNQIAGYGISNIKDVIELLSNGEAVPYTGIYGIDVTEDMSGQGLPAGLYVKSVEADSPAMAAGIQNGDIITTVDGTPITGITDYHEILMKKASGSEIVLKGFRQGTGGEYVELDFKVTVKTKNEK